MGKITVKHYLNTNLKPYIINGEKYYKIYVLIRADTQNTKIKSDISANEYTEKEFEKHISDKTGEIAKAIKEETKIIRFIVELIKKNGQVFTSAIYTEYAKRYKRPFWQWFKELKDELAYYEKLNCERKNIIKPIQIFHDNCYINLSFHYDKLIDELLRDSGQMLSRNFIIRDFYLVQWFTTDIKTHFRRLYLKKMNVQSMENRAWTGNDETEEETEVYEDIDNINKEIRKYFGMDLN